MEVEDTMKTLRTGEITALESLYTEMRIPVYATVLSILRNRAAAEDALQETFVRVYEKISAYAPGTNPRAWVISIARNIALDMLRKGSRISKLSPQGFGDAEYEQVNRTYHDSCEGPLLTKMELSEAVLRLDEAERQIVVLHAVAGLTHDETAKELKMPPGTVRWKYRLALKKLAKAMGGEKDAGERP